MAPAANATVSKIQFRFVGNGAQTVLTDCPFAAPTEVTCNASLISVSESPGPSAPQLFLELLTVHLHADGTFEVEFGPSGVADAQFSVNGSLGAAHASASVDVGLGSPVGVVVDWTAQGRLNHSGSNSHFMSNCSVVISRFVGKDRLATAVGTVNGDAQISVPPDQFPTVIFFSNSGFLEVDRTC
jgi:hypothetical protein